MVGPEFFLPNTELGGGVNPVLLKTATKEENAMNTNPCYRKVGITLLMGLFAFGLLAVLLSTANVLAAPGQRSISAGTAPMTSTVYLPLILNNFPPIPQLVSPQNGAGLGTLIPTFIWDTGTQPTNTIGCLALSTTPHPTACKSTYYLDYSGPHKEEVMWYNLAPSTVYYWRVGAVYNSDYSNPKWSAEWSFTTGAAGGPIPAAPVLLSPTNNSIVSTSVVTLTWQPVAGAIEYDVTLHGLDTDRWAGFDPITSTQKAIDVAYFVEIGYGNSFEWYVVARNGYAWGNDSEKWKFTHSTNTNLSSRDLPGSFFTLEEAAVLEKMVFRFR
jgi:hypothetical protein